MSDEAVYDPTDWYAWDEERGEWVFFVHTEYTRRVRNFGLDTAATLSGHEKNTPGPDVPRDPDPGPR